MTTSDQQGPLTRKQLRELRLTGSTPIITEDAANAAAPVTPPAATPPAPTPPAPTQTPAEPVPVVEENVDPDATPLTRRQARAQERIRTASVPVIAPHESDAEASDEPAQAEPELVLEAEPVEESPALDAGDHVDEPVLEAEPVPEAEPVNVDEDSASSTASPEIVSEVPDFASADDDDEADDEVQVVPVSAAGAAKTVGEVPLEVVDDKRDESDDLDDMLGADQDAEDDSDDVLAGVGSDEDPTTDGERPTVNPAFGQGVLKDPSKPFAPSFDELLSVDSGGSQHGAANALIFTPSAGEGSLSGPVASTGEILITGSYELPRGIGSQGHAHGVADGKDVDAVLIDGELPPASSPTPIAASSAVSTIKPAGEVIRPPAPEKGNKLMLILAIVAGGLALALGVALVFAFTTNVF
jgi:hypothetical protein